MKKWILVLLCLCLTGCSQPQKEVYPETEEQEQVSFVNPDPADMSGYAGFTDQEHAYIEITLEESLNKARKEEDFVIYYGNDHCPWCTEMVPVLNEVAKEEKVLIYYVDTSKPSNYSEDLYNRLLQLFGDMLEMDEDGVRNFFVPDVAVVKEGTVVMNHIATVDTHDPYEKPMTGKERKQLKEIYAEMIAQVK